MGSWRGLIMRKEGTGKKEGRREGIKEGKEKRKKEGRKGLEGMNK